MTKSKDTAALQKAVHSIAEALLDIALVEDVESVNVHAIQHHDGTAYISGFAIEGETLLFDFREITAVEK